MGWVSDLISLADAGDSVVQDFECNHGRVGCGLTPAHQPSLCVQFVRNLDFIYK